MVCATLTFLDALRRQHYSRLMLTITAARAIKRNWQLRWFDARTGNHILEGLNSLVQAANGMLMALPNLRNVSRRLAGALAQSKELER